MKATGLFALCAGLVLASALSSVRAADQKLSAADQKFVRDANIINMTEMQAGKLAEQQSSNTAIRRLGERLVQDHTQMEQALQQLAQRKNVTLPKTLDDKHKDLLNKLAGMRGAQFDQMFAKEMAHGHEQAIEKFENEIKNGQDMDIKAYAQKWLPSLREHLQLARSAMTTR